jgi:hypothetical protein
MTCIVLLVTSAFLAAMVMLSVNTIFGTNETRAAEMECEIWKRTRQTCTTCIYICHKEDEWPCDRCPTMINILEKRSQGD